MKFFVVVSDGKAALKNVIEAIALFVMKPKLYIAKVGSLDFFPHISSKSLRIQT